MFREMYRDVFTGDEAWASLDVADSALYPWDPLSSYICRPPYFEGLPPEPAPVTTAIPIIRTPPCRRP